MVFMQAVELGEMALNHHTDPGILTLLLQDMTGGLTSIFSSGWLDRYPAPKERYYCG